MAEFGHGHGLCLSDCPFLLLASSSCHGTNFLCMRSTHISVVSSLILSVHGRSGGMKHVHQMQHSKLLLLVRSTMHSKLHGIQIYMAIYFISLVDIIISICWLNLTHVLSDNSKGMNKTQTLLWPCHDVCTLVLVPSQSFFSFCKFLETLNHLELTLTDVPAFYLL